jgi:GT2 family glycosyltransferase
VSETVCAVAVTHNRCALLEECLDAVLAQTRAPDEVLVVDNASTDGTTELLQGYDGRVDVLRLAQNEGSSGGFHAGFAEGVRRGADWLWVMDDDTIPTAPALERLLAARETLDGLPEPVLLASKVVWSDGRVHPMNPPAPHPMDIDVFMRALERGLMPIRSNTFPSLLVRRVAVERHGAPRKGFWIWADDIDFTQRILRDEPGYVVPSSVALHKTKTPHTPWEGGERFYYAVRNGLFILRGDTLRAKEKVGWTLLVAEQIRRFLLVERFRPKAWAIVLRGLRDGVIRARP